MSGAVTPVTPLGGCSASPLGVRSVAKLVPRYAGPCMHVIRASDGREAEIGFDGLGRVDLGAARSFARTATLSAGVLWVKLWFDQAGVNHLRGFPQALPSLCSERDAYGAGFPDCGFVLQDGAKDFYPHPLSRALHYPADCTFALGNTAAFLVARPTVSVSGNAWITLGDPDKGASLSLFTAERSPSTPGGLTLACRTGTGEVWIGAGDITAVPRVNRHCLGLVSRRSGIRVFSGEQALPSFAPMPRGATVAGNGGIGATATSGFNAANDLYASIEFPGSITDEEAGAIMAVLADTFDTGMRANRLISDGSSTPRGQGTEGNVCYPKLLQGSLERQVDVFNLSINGYTIDDLLANCPTRVLPLIWPGVNCIYCPDGISNSIAKGDTAQAVFAKLKNLCHTVKVAGAKVVVATAKNRGDLSATARIERGLLNALIRSGWRCRLGADVILDIDGIPETQDAGDARYFQPDGVHNKNPIHIRIGRLAAEAIAPLLV